MASPEHFEILYELKTNLAMDKTRQPDRATALRQWRDLREALTQYGVSILSWPSAGPGISDFTFVANAGLPIPGTDAFILSNFHHQERRLEIPHLKKFLQNEFELVELAPDEEFEGGDAFFWRDDILFIAYGVRTNLNGALAVGRLVKNLAPRTTVELLPMEFWVEQGSRKEMSFYHRDMCCLPLRNKLTFLVYPYSFTFAALRILEHYGELVFATRDQAYHFVCNGIEIDGKNVILPWLNDHTVKQFLDDFGYSNIHICPTSEFWLSGGGPQCLFLEIP